MEISASFDPIQISKIFITGPLSPSMPYIVLSELALECSIIVTVEELQDPVVYGKTFKKIAKFNAPFVNNLYEPEQILKIKKYINPLCNWNLEKLSHAFTFINYFRNIFREDKSFPGTQEFLIGLQTPENEYSINACVLYGAAKFKQIQPIPLDITYQDLKYMVDNNINIPRPLKLNVRVIKEPEDDNISVEISLQSPMSVETILPDEPTDVNGKEDKEEPGNNDASEADTDNESIEECDENILPDDDGLDLYLSSDEKNKKWVSEERFDYFKSLSSIQGISELYEDIDYLRNHFQPLNDEQAIVCAAYTYNKDFSQHKSPLIEFSRFKNDIPCHDINIRKFEYKNKYYSDLLMYFNPYLPFKLYKRQNIENHLRLFSYPSYEFIGLNAYEILQELHLQENFYLGWHPNIINFETPIELEPIEEIPSEEIICFGTRQDGMKATSWSELYDLFKNTNLFLNPFEKNKLFSISQIERLVKLGNWIFDCPFEYKYLFIYNPNTKEQIRKCVDLISHMIIMQKEDFRKLKEWKIMFDNLNEKNKNIIKKGIRKLFELTMKMRGWKEYEHYPITITPPYSNEEIEKRTLEAIIELDECNQESNDFIYSLPLIIWKNEFIQSMIEEQGITIGDRIKIVKKGESEGVSSCIRLTSNVLGATYCFYSKLFGLKEEFDIKDLIYIQ